MFFIKKNYIAILYCLSLQIMLIHHYYASEENYHANPPLSIPKIKDAEINIKDICNVKNTTHSEQYKNLPPKKHFPWINNSNGGILYSILQKK